MDDLLIIVGPTAVGKTEVSLRLAEEIGAEIVSADSMQVYRGMDIGTAKPTAEERARVPHHLIDVAEPTEEFSAGRYLELAEAAVEDIKKRGKTPLVVGGTGLYVRALMHGLFEGPAADWEYREGLLEKERKEGEGTLYGLLSANDPVSAARIKPGDIRRIVRALEVYEKRGVPMSQAQEAHASGGTVRPVRIAGLRRERPELYRRIEERVDAMMDEGLLEEVRALRGRGCVSGMVSMQALGYKQLMAHLDGAIGLDEAVGLIKRDTRRYAKRQFTWFGAVGQVRWVDIKEGSRADETVAEIKKALDIFGDLR